MLKCSDGSYYVGHTDNLEQRIAAHKSKEFNGYTASRLPLEVVFVQAFPLRDEAFSAECQIKGWSRKKKEALIRSDWLQIGKLAKKFFK